MFWPTRRSPISAGVSRCRALSAFNVKGAPKVASGNRGRVGDEGERKRNARAVVGHDVAARRVLLQPRELLPRGPVVFRQHVEDQTTFDQRRDDLAYGMIPLVG